MPQTTYTLRFNGLTHETTKANVAEWAATRGAIVTAETHTTEDTAIEAFIQTDAWNREVFMLAEGGREQAQLSGRFVKSDVTVDVEACR